MTNMSILFPIVITWIIVAAIVVVFAATRKPLSNEDTTAQDKYPQYFFISLSTALGVAGGILLGLALGSVSGGIALGIGVGLIVGQLLEKRQKGGVPPLTEQEKRERLNRAGVGLVAVIIFVIVILLATILELFRS